MDTQRINKPLKSRKIAPITQRRSLPQCLVGFALAVSLWPAAFAAPPTTADYQAVPPFVAENSGKPNVIIALDISGSMKAVAYRDTGAGNWRNGLHDDFKPATPYFGYFDSTKKYRYDASLGFFVEDANGDWDGNFLNWMAMRRMDIVRQVLVGGKVRDRNGEALGGTTYYVVQGQNEPYDYTFRKAYSNGSAYTPFPDNQEFIMDTGMIKPVTVNGTFTVPLDSNIEVGRVSMDWQYTNSDPDRNNLANWKSVTFSNTYVEPVVVAVNVSYNGGDPVLARVADVTTTGFKVRLQEWDSKDGKHTTEDIFYIVAEKGHHHIDTDSGSINFDAGKIFTDTTAGSFETVSYYSSFTTTPVVFSGVSSFNDVASVTTRKHSITAAGFQVALQEEENADQDHSQEEIHYIAIEKGRGITNLGNIPFEISDTGNAVTHAWYTQSFTTTFSTEPLVVMDMQTFNGPDPANVRSGNAVLSTTAIDMQIDEEKSADNEVDHVTEKVGYIAVPVPGYNIQLGLTAEPTGIVQDNSGGMRFGMAVYNYDHTRSPTSVYTGNTVDGGTFHPCYPDVSLPTASRTNYDICRETHVKSPLSNIVDVIEDHPLIWGTTPIAETLYDIYGYVQQKNFAKNGHTQWYDNGTENATQMNSYEISNDWDPYYYDEYSAKLKCAKTFVLHFNDGAPYEDWEGGTPADPTVNSDGVGDTGKNEQLDDLALELRKNDCRSDIGGHQEIISYYVYAALGEGEVNNDSTRRMREAAANGGFVDADGDNEPDPAHPANFKTYYQTYLNGGSCTANEWDANGDCNPDTFYLANDGYQLVAELTAAFQSIARRASAGGSASVISASASGEGAIYQASFQTTMSDGTYQVAWTGDVNALLVDDAGLIRQDNNSNQTLEGPATDNILDMCFNSADQSTYIKLSTSEGARPTEAQTIACSNSVFTETPFSINYLWSGGERLANLTDTQAKTQRNYTSATPGRYIFTAIDSKKNTGTVAARVTSTETVPFLPASFDASNAGLLQAADAAEAAKIVNYIRGEDQPGYRSRELQNNRTWRLGDVIYSTPTAVARPSEAFDILYNDASYSAFLKQYRNRRHMVYAGGNDGMLHAFNAGWYDAPNRRFLNGPTGSTQYDLGAEMWAYVPYNLLPHLKYLTDTNYGKTTGNHVYYVDLRPRIFDAKIFADDNTHPGGWGTVLVGGMRFGGGEISVDVDTSNPGGDIRTMRSAYFILDITDPEQPPELLLEFSHEDLGFTSSIPAPFISEDKWYLMLGSGPTATRDGLTAVKSTKNGRLFLLNLHTLSLEAGFGAGGISVLSDSNSFISDLIAVDWDLDANADGIFFGTVSGTAAPWKGKLYQVETQDIATIAVKAPSNWTPSVLIDAGRPIVAKPSFTFDDERNRWVLFGSGRYFTRDDALDNASQRFYGLKMTRDTTGAFTGAAPDTNKLANVTSAVVRENTGKLTGVTGILSSPAPATFSELLEKMTQYDTAGDYQSGWYRDALPAGNRIIGEATILGDSLTHTLYDPSDAACKVEGLSQLSVTHFATGTAGNPPVIGTTGSADSDGNYVIKTTLDLGVAPSLSPALHSGSGYNSDGSTKAFIQTSTGKIVTIEQENKGAVRSGEASWRELQE
ncbi:MAG TPA: hypothetical protein ENI94_10825 [Gammaproteobacteria bacterium]|nr:hypothetical protein [Gammaproteobacteria bacterium]